MWKNVLCLFKLRTDLLRLLLHPKTVHMHFEKPENTLKQITI